MMKECIPLRVRAIWKSMSKIIMNVARTLYYSFNNYIDKYRRKGLIVLRLYEAATLRSKGACKGKCLP